MDQSPLKFLLYSHDTYGLGHIRRTLTITWALSEAFPRATFLCVTGSPRVHSFPLPPRTDYIRLPAATKDAVGRYVPLRLKVSFEELLALRRAAIEKSVLRYGPDCVLVDHAPLGMAGELAGALRMLRDRRPQTRIVLGLRDIYDDGETVREAWKREGVLEVLNEVYDDVFVYGQRGVFDVAREYGLEYGLAEKVRYMGYVHRAEPTADLSPSLRAQLGLDQRPLVLVTVGGGGDGHQIVARYLDGLAVLPQPLPWRSLVVFGPLMDRVSREDLLWRAHGRAGVTLLRFTPELRRCMADADAVVSMGGYNTVVEALALGKRCVVVPRVAPRQEQLVRAQRFGNLGLLRWLDPRSLGPQVLVEAVREALESPPPAVNGKLDFGGAQRTSWTLADLFKNGARAHSPTVRAAPLGLGG
jgi:predicted glycosyltransferase